jgi:hypothetical protein
MKLRSHSFVSCHLVAIHGTPKRITANVVKFYYRYDDVLLVFILCFSCCLLYFNLLNSTQYVNGPDRPNFYDIFQNFHLSVAVQTLPAKNMKRYFKTQTNLITLSVRLPVTGKCTEQQQKIENNPQLQHYYNQPSSIIHYEIFALM